MHSDRTAVACRACKELGGEWQAEHGRSSLCQQAAENHNNFLGCQTHARQVSQLSAGRIKDLVESGKLSLAAVKHFVLDEADRLLDTGNQDLILSLFSRFAKAGTGTARLQVRGRSRFTLS